MSCPTCDATMQNLGVESPPDRPGRQVFWCPRCGTIRERSKSSPLAEPFVQDAAPRWCRRLDDDGPPLPMLTLTHLNNLAQYATYIDVAKDFLRGLQADIAEANEKTGLPVPNWPPPGVF